MIMQKVCVIKARSTQKDNFIHRVGWNLFDRDGSHEINSPNQPKVIKNCLSHHLNYLLEERFEVANQSIQRYLMLSQLSYRFRPALQI